MQELLRKLVIWICAPIYKAIKGIYEIFYALAGAEFLSSDIINTLSSNLYVLVSVVMLFAFSATLLSSIVNPSLIDNKDKGLGAVFKRAIIGIALIVFIPIAFKQAYEIQKEILDNNIIEKVIVGMKIKDGDNKGGNGGQVIAGTLLSAVIYPAEEGIQVSQGAYEAYNNTMVNDIEYIYDLADYINEKPEEGSEKFVFKFESLVALIAGGVAVYLLLMFSIDMAVRMFKLTFLQLTAPISVISYIAVGGDKLKSWAKLVGVTFVEVFTAVAAMAFYLFLLKNMNNAINTIGADVNYQILLKILIIVGMLIFVKKIPDLVKQAFGIDLSSKGGIGGRLGEMAGIGKQAKEAWGSFTKSAAKIGGGALLVGATGGAALGGLGFLGGSAAIAGTALGGKKLRDSWKTGGLGADTRVGAGLRKFLINDKKKRDEFEKNNPYYQQKEYEKDKEKEEKLKAKASNTVDSTKKDKDGNDLKVKTSDGNYAGGATKLDDINKFVNALNGITAEQRAALNKVASKQNDSMSKNQNQNLANQIVSSLKNAQNNAQTSLEKNKFQDIIDKFNNGEYHSASELTRDISVKGLTSSMTQDSYDRIENLSNKLQVNVNADASYKDGFGTSIEKYASISAEATNAYDGAVSELDRSMEKATAEQKQVMKKAKKVVNDANKDITGTA